MVVIEAFSMVISFISMTFYSYEQTADAQS